MSVCSVERTIIYFLFVCRLYNLKPEDSGYYLCFGTNKVGQDRAYVYVEVRQARDENADQNNESSIDRNPEQEENQQPQVNNSGDQTSVGGVAPEVEVKNDRQISLVEGIR
jgi:hypothetical protein